MRAFAAGSASPAALLGGAGLPASLPAAARDSWGAATAAVQGWLAGDGRRRHRQWPRRPLRHQAREPDLRGLQHFQDARSEHCPPPPSATARLPSARLPCRSSLLHSTACCNCQDKQAGLRTLRLPPPSLAARRRPRQVLLNVLLQRVGAEARRGARQRHLRAAGIKERHAGSATAHESGRPWRHACVRMAQHKQACFAAGCTGGMHTHAPHTRGRAPRRCRRPRRQPARGWSCRRRPPTRAGT